MHKNMCMCMCMHMRMCMYVHAVTPLLIHFSFSKNGKYETRGTIFLFLRE